MTIVKLRSGGIWVHAPIAPTKECIQPPDCINKESSLAAAKNGLAVKILSKGREVPHDPVEDNKLNRQIGTYSLIPFLN
ncbi:hypothetical protein ZWY2020_034289 [Hordeum vulgare]|nr:hypothetical protein ZWY2020_034289 [Hordeum vulgare]